MKVSAFVKIIRRETRRIQYEARLSQAPLHLLGCEWDAENVMFPHYNLLHIPLPFNHELSRARKGLHMFITLCSDSIVLTSVYQMSMTRRSITLKLTFSRLYITRYQFELELFILVSLIVVQCICQATI